MQRLTQPKDDQGIITIVVVCIFLVMLFGFAFATDVGIAVAATRSAQNSADAAALAEAQSCARGTGSFDPAPYIRTEEHETAATPTCGTNSVTVTVENTKDYTFGQIVGLDTFDVDRSATAKWGTLGGAHALPVAIASCEFSLALLDGTSDITLYLDDPKVQSGCMSIPGGFSQLEAADTACRVDIDVNGDVAGKPGGDLHKKVPCITPLPKDVLVPIYDETLLTKDQHDNGQGPYHILGFAVFHVTGYSFEGGNHDGTLGKDCPLRAGEDKNTVPKYCIRGDFIRFVTSQGTPGNSADFGAYLIYLDS
jgi:hypothetical protein